MTSRRSVAIAFSVLLAGLVAGCKTTDKILKADAAPDSGFLSEPERMAEDRARAPFNRAWADPSFSAASYRTLFVAPVNTEHVLKENAWARANVRQFRIEKDIASIATDFRKIVIEEFRDSDDNRFEVVETPRDDSMILELAITELVPGKAFIGAVGLAAWGAPLPIGIPAGAVASFADDGWMAIEGRVRDAKSDQVMAMFADREKGKTRILDVEAATWYGHARESMHDWAEQLVRLANTPKDVQVDDSAAFELMPW
jgi:Protein of unknown function (DUF3313)